LSSPTGEIALSLYGSLSQVTSDDFAAYSTIPLNIDDVPSPSMSEIASDFSVLTANGEIIAGYMNEEMILSFTNLALSSQYTPESSDTLKLYFDGRISLKDPKICTLNSHYGGCVISVTPPVIEFKLHPSFIGVPMDSLPDLSIQFANLYWETLEPCFFKLAIHEGSATYISYSLFYEPAPREITLSVTPLHLMENAYSEYQFSGQLGQFTYSKEILSIQYSGDIEIRANHLDQIDCICSLKVKCYKYDKGGENAIDIIFLQNLPQDSAYNCYVPDLKNNLSPVSFQARVIKQVNRIKSYISPLVTITFTQSSAPSHTFEVNYPSPSYPDIAYPLTADFSSSASYTAGSYLYIDFGAGGPILPSCPISELGECRSYSAVRYICVKKMNSFSGSFFSGNFKLPYKVSETQANYTVTSFISSPDKTEIVTYDSRLVTPISKFKPERTNLKIKSSQLLAKLFSTFTVSFKTGTLVIQQSILDEGGLILLEVTGPTGIQTCYASVDYKPLLCSYIGSEFQITPYFDIPSGSSIEVIFTAFNPPDGGKNYSSK